MAVQPLDPGAFTSRLELQRPVATEDGQGGITRSWHSITSLWAAVRPMTVAVTEEAGGEVFRSTHEIWLYRREDLESGLRFRFGARTFKLNSWRDPDETKRYTVCRCEEVGV